MKLQISSIKKQKEQLKKWFTESNIPFRAWVVWCDKQDGTGFNEKETSKLHEALELIDYTNIPKRFGNGYVLPYTALGKNKRLYKDVWSGEAVIDPDDALNELSEEQMVLLKYGVDIDGIIRPKRESALIKLLKSLINLDNEWEEIKNEFNELKESEKAAYRENVYWNGNKEILVSPASQAIGNEPYSSSTSEDVYSKRIQALRKDLANEMDYERKYVLQLRLDDLEQEVADMRSKDTINNIHRKRLAILKNQAALLGYSAPPHIIWKLNRLKIN